MRYKIGLCGVILTFVICAIVSAQDINPDIAAIAQGDIGIAKRISKTGGEEYVGPFLKGMMSITDDGIRKKMRKYYLVLLKTNYGAEDIKKEDTNNDSERDKWTLSKDVNGEKRILLIVQDTNNDLIPNREVSFKDGIKMKAVEDTNGDLKYDVYEDYLNGALVRKSIDKDFDGTYDMVENYDGANVVSVENYHNGVLQEKRYDINFDGNTDLVEEFKDGIIQTSKEDTDHDRVYNLFSEYSNGSLLWRKFDKNNDGTVDRTERYFGDVVLHSESDGNFDGKIDFVEEYENGVIVTSKKDTDFDGIFNLFSEYTSGVLQSQKIDENNDGTINILVKVSDINKDNKVDHWEYKDKNGNLVRIGRDSNLDENEDKWEFYEAGKLVKREFDRDFDSHLDERELLNENGEIVRIEYDTELADKVYSFDKFEFFENNLLVRREWDCDKKNKWDCIRDSKIDKIEYFDDKENRTMVAYDIKDMDGRMDRWEYFENGRLDKIGSDKNLDGKPDNWMIVDVDGETQGSIEDTDFDGINDKFSFFDKWAYLNQRNHFDRDVFYRNKDLSILEFDINNNGEIDRWEYYNEEHKKLKVESDSNNDGKIDQWDYYDKWEYYGKDEKIVKTKNDQTGDEIPVPKGEDDPLAYYVDNVYTNYNETVDRLILDLQYGTSERRMSGALRLAELVKKGNLRAESGFTALVKALKDPNLGVVVAVINSLGEFEDVRAVVPLSKFIKEINYDVNIAAMEAMAALGRSRSLPFLYEFLNKVETRLLRIKKNDKQGEAQKERPELNRLIIAGIGALAAISNNDSVKTIIQYIEKYDPEVRMAAVKALGQFMDDRAIEPLGDRI